MENKEIENVRDILEEFGKVVGPVGNNKKCEKNDYLNKIDGKIDKLM